MKDNEGMIEFLERAAEWSELGRSLGGEIWIELVYQIVWARDQFVRKAPMEEQDGVKDQLTALAYAADNLLDAAGTH
ncbi:hypothetical protein QBC44DRAFT_393864 [Cladorrhinum sp. PSN332]|nr:hypothetical protein QBC44DRAFT_393864 [Cladorrhinum sp. PSN332]